MAPRGATVTLMADRRTPGVLDLARALTARLRGGSERRVALLVDPALAREAVSLSRDPGEVAVPATVPALLARLRASTDTVLAFRGPVREPLLAAIDRSALVIVVTADGVASLRAAQRALSLFAQVGFPRERVEVALMAPEATLPPDLDMLRGVLARDVTYVLSRATPDDPVFLDAVVRRARGA